MSAMPGWMRHVRRYPKPEKRWVCLPHWNFYFLQRCSPISISRYKSMQEFMGQSIGSAALKAFDFGTLYIEDWTRALSRRAHDKFLSLSDTVCFGNKSRLHRILIRSVFSMTDRAARKKEQKNMPSGVVMAVLYTQNASVVTLSIFKSAYYL